MFRWGNVVSVAAFHLKNEKENGGSQWWIPTTMKTADVLELVLHSLGTRDQNIGWSRGSGGFWQAPRLASFSFSRQYHRDHHHLLRLETSMGLNNIDIPALQPPPFFPAADLRLRNGWLRLAGLIISQFVCQKLCSLHNIRDAF